jgi:hypothetical protein
MCYHPTERTTAGKPWHCKEYLQALHRTNRARRVSPYFPRTPARATCHPRGSSPILAFSRFHVPCARSRPLHTRSIPSGRPDSSTPRLSRVRLWRAPLSTAAPSPCWRPAPRLFPAPDSALPAPLLPRRAAAPRISCCIRWNRRQPLLLPVGRTSVRPLALLSASRLLDMLPSGGGSAALYLCSYDSHTPGITMRSLGLGAAPVCQCPYVYKAMACS